MPWSSWYWWDTIPTICSKGIQKSKKICLSVRSFKCECVLFKYIKFAQETNFFYKICYFSLGLAKVIKSFAGIVITVGMGQSIVRAEGKLREAPNTLVFDWFSKEKTLSFESFVSYYLTIPTNQNDLWFFLLYYVFISMYIVGSGSLVI